MALGDDHAEQIAINGTFAGGAGDDKYIENDGVFWSASKGGACVGS